MAEHGTHAQVKPAAAMCDQCSKPFSSKQSLTRHIKTIHDGIVSLKSLFSTPKESLNPKNRLFTSVPNLSVQGNSDGQVNDPPVTSEGTFICGTCDLRLLNEEDMTNHNDDIHDKASTAAIVEETDGTSLLSENAKDNNILDNEDDQALREAMESQEEEDIFKALEMLTQSDFDPEKDVENKRKSKEKLDRYRTIMMKKTDLQKQTGEKVKQLEEQIGYMKHDASLHNEVVENGKITLDEKDKEITDVTNELKRTKEKHGKDKQEFKISLDKLQKENGKLVKEKQDIKFEVENQKAIIMSLKEKLEDDDVIEDTEEVEEEEDAEIQVTARVNMNKDLSGNKCTACDKIFNKNQDLERHMNAKHSEQQCILCEKMCSSEQELVRHQAQCVEQGVKTVNCKKCKQTFTNFGLKRHSPKCHGEEKHVCPKCGQVEKTAKAVKNHIQAEHEDRMERSREVCWHWRQGNCFRGNTCHFSHVGFQRRSTPMQESSTRTNACKNGRHCQWKERGHCRYYHEGVGVQKPRGVQEWQGGRQGPGGKHGAQQYSSHTSQICRWDQDCFRKSTCKFIHTSSKDFPQRRQQTRPIGGNQGRRFPQGRN